MIVTMDVYSGRPNPSWTLSEKDSKELVSRIAGRAVAASQDADGHLGFRGYIVSTASDDDDTATAAGLPDAFRLPSAALQGMVPAPPAQVAQPLTTEELGDMQKWLLTTVAGAVEDSVLEHVAGQITGTGAADVTAEASAAAACIIQNCFSLIEKS